MEKEKKKRSRRWFLIPLAGLGVGSIIFFVGVYGLIRFFDYKHGRDGVAKEVIDGQVIYNLVQLPDEGILGGLCAGIGYRYGFDPLYARLGFIGLTLFGDIGVPLYIITCWLVDEANTPDGYKLRIYGATPPPQGTTS